jgi:hypothetical protein
MKVISLRDLDGRKAAKRTMSLISSVFNRLGSADDGNSSKSGDSDERKNDVRTRVFRCESCDTVYIAEAKNGCSQCGGEVVSKPATLR